ncbi:hypothetical protein V8E53_004214 [Lactarius tabidus]
MYHSSRKLFGASCWAPFRSQCDWELACWAKMCGPSSWAVEELLAIPGVVDKLGLSFSSTKELNDIIDSALPGRPPFECRELVIGGETLELYFRDVLSCIRSLYGNPELAQDLVTAPERHYSDNEQMDHVYSEMHTGDWWWAVQTTLESYRPGATVVPVIISSNKTQLTLFRGKSAYPVYLTIGNIPKAIRCKPTRRAQILLAYIPTTKLKGITNKTGHRCAMANLYHILVMCTYNNRCPKCIVLPDKLGSHVRYPPHNYDQAMNAYLLADGDAHTFHSACREADQKLVFHPFWESLPLANVFVSITPDILHQLLQGVLKHMITWLIGTFGAVEIDTRCRSLPPNHHISVFTKGISGLSRITGKEHKNMSRILLGLILDLPVPDGQVSPRILAVVRTLLDFLYLAQLPAHTSTSLMRLDDALSRYHSNKDVFIDLGIRNHFNMVKIHSLVHYGPSIRLFGTTDNYNTEQTEWLHIELTKNAYGATNHKDEYSQMTTWLGRCEKVQIHSSFIKWRQESNQERVPTLAWIGPPRAGARSLKMARNPTLKAVSFDDLARKYSATDFQDALADFVAQINNPTASGASLSALTSDTLIPFHTVPVHHRFKFTNLDGSEIVDSVLVRPEQKDVRGRLIPSQFDTVLVRSKSTSQDFVRGNDGHRVAQVVNEDLFTSPNTTPRHLAYVEWFSPIPISPGSNHGLYKVHRLTHNSRWRASIIPVDSILRSVHLFPVFGPRTPKEWNTFLVLELCNSFYINPFSDRDNYLMLS